MHILRQIQVAQHKTHTQRNPAIIHAVICVYVCGGCYSCPLKFSKKQQPPPPPSPKRATEANGFKQYLIISVIQRQLRLDYHTQNECVGFFGHGQVFARGPLHGKHTTHAYIRTTNTYTYIIIFFHTRSLVFSLLLYHFVRSQRVFVYMLCKQTRRATEREGSRNGGKVEGKNLLNFCARTQWLYT